MEILLNWHLIRYFSVWTQSLLIITEWHSFLIAHKHSPLNVGSLISYLLKLSHKLIRTLNSFIHIPGPSYYLSGMPGALPNLSFYCFTNDDNSLL